MNEKLKFNKALNELVGLGKNDETPKYWFGGNCLRNNKLTILLKNVVHRKSNS